MDRAPPAPGGLLTANIQPAWAGPRSPVDRCATMPARAHARRDRQRRLRAPAGSDRRHQRRLHRPTAGRPRARSLSEDHRRRQPRPGGCRPGDRPRAGRRRDHHRGAGADRGRRHPGGGRAGHRPGPGVSPRAPGPDRGLLPGPRPAAVALEPEAGVHPPGGHSPAESGGYRPLLHPRGGRAHPHRPSRGPPRDGVPAAHRRPPTRPSPLRPPGGDRVAAGARGGARGEPGG